MESMPTEVKPFKQTKIISASTNFDSEPISSAPTCVFCRSILKLSPLTLRTSPE